LAKWNAGSTDAIRGFGIPPPSVRCPVRIRIGVLVALSLATATLAGPAVAGDGGGSGILTGQGSFILTPVGSYNYSLHAYLSAMGFPVQPGDTLIYSWSVNNGSGPPVYFEIHGHPPGRYDVFYNTTASSVNGTFTARLQEPYMVFWRNDQTVRLNVTYAFNLVPGQSPLWPLYLAPLAIAGVAAGGAIVILRDRRTRRRR